MHACACCSEAQPTPTVTILGLTFKENVPDIRNSKVVDIARALGIVRDHRCRCTIRSRSAEEAMHEYGIALCRSRRFGRPMPSSLRSRTKIMCAADGR